MSITPLLSFISFIFTLSLSPAVHADLVKSTSPFHEITRFNLGGDGGWDYLTVDSEARRVYIARTNRVMVIDADSGRSVGEVQGLDGAHGIALVKDLGGSGLGFATSGKSGEVIVFDLSSLKVVSKIKAGEKPDAIIYNPASRRVLAFNGNSHSVTVIDPATQKSVGTISLAGKPEFAASDSSARVFVNLEDKSELLELDPIQLKVIATYPLTPCEEPTGLSMDVASKRLIVGCGNKLSAIVDADSGKLVKTFDVGSGVDATAFDPERKLAFVSAGEGILTVLSESAGGFQVLQNLQTVQGARTLAVDWKTGRVFLPTARFNPSPAKPANGHARPSVIPGTFALLVVGHKD